MNKILNFGRFVINEPMNKDAEWLEKNNKKISETVH